MPIRTCPRCNEPLHQGFSACRVCQFSLDEADAVFGARRVRLRGVIDACEAFGEQDKLRMEEKIGSFEADFPQLFFAIYAAKLPRNINLRELGFWLLNRAVLESTRSNENAIVLCINSTVPSASITLGYLPEQHLSEQQLDEILLSGRELLGTRKFFRFSSSCLRGIALSLKQQAIPA